jgi:hypothetical protein
MKKIIFMLLALTALYGCSKMEQIPDDDSDLLIKLEGAINPVNPDSRAEETDPTKPSAPMDLVVLRANAVGESQEYTGGYTSPVNATLNENGTITWEPVLNYLKDGTYTKLIGLYPRVDEANLPKVNLTAKTVTYEGFDGTTDIMCSDFLEGSKDYKITAKMVLDHKLTQVQVYVKGESASDNSGWGKVTGITIPDKAGDVVVTVPDPTTSSPPIWSPSNFSLTKKKPLTVLPLSGVDGSFGTTEAEYGVVMFVPSTANETLTFNITTESSGGARPASTTTSRSYEAATAYKIVINLKDDDQISIGGGTGGDGSGSITTWTNFDDGATVEEIDAD